jgi:hypothetical protein
MEPFMADAVLLLLGWLLLGAGAVLLRETVIGVRNGPRDISLPTASILVVNSLSTVFLGGCLALRAVIGLLS